MPIIDTPSLPGVETTREGMRKWIAYTALVAFFGLIAFVIIVAWVWRAMAIDDVIKILTTTAGVMSGVVGAIVGFYFHSERES